MGNKKDTQGARRRGAKKIKKVKTLSVQRPPRQLTPAQVAALKDLGLADAYTIKPETDKELRSKKRLDEVETDWVKLICTAEQEAYNTNLSDPDIVPLLPRAS